MIGRLKREFAFRRGWPDFERVVTAKMGASLAAYELLVCPRPTAAGNHVGALRVLVEHLSLPATPS